jgi:UDP-N-acetylmuramoyl-tripeptide--D-alanyl-D-alanine ligase
MKPNWTLNQIAKWINGKILSTHQENFSDVGTDTRKKLTEKIFIALKGDAFDAHAYLDKAVDQGAGLLIIHELKPEFESLKNTVSIIFVDDTLRALQNFAHNYRKTLTAKIISITGSNGKTTTKEFTAKILNQYKKTHLNFGSFNNHWGVPLTLLEIPTDAAFAVVEMGMNHAGEITKLVEIAEPDVVVCTMVGRAHIEHFGTIQKIAKAKEEIYQASSENAVRIFNQDQDETYDMMYPVAKKYPASRMLSFSEKNDEADVYFKIENQSGRGMTISGSIAAYKSTSTIPVFGKHNVINLMAASCLAYSVGMKPEDIWKALPLCKSAWGRNEFIQTHCGADILFDGYNANPDSMKALLENIPQLKAESNKIAAFGQMKELGDHAAAEHIALAELATQSGFNFIYFIGENANDFEIGLKNKNYKNYLCETNLSEKMAEHFKKQIGAGDLVVIKGSRGARTERFTELCDPINWKSK